MRGALPPCSPHAGAPPPPNPRALRVPLRRAVSVLAVTRCGMIAARLSRDDCLLQGRYEPPARPRRSQRSRQEGWPLFAPKRCQAAATQPPALFVGYRLPLPRQVRSLALRSCRRCRSSTIVIGFLSVPRCRAFHYFCGGVHRARWARGGTEPPAAGTPAPRIPGGGDPRPAFSPSPPLRGRAVVATLPFFFGYRVGGRRRRLGALDAPPRPLPSGAGVRYATRRPLWSRPRRRRRPPSRTRRSNKNVLGLPKKPFTLRDSRSRPPRNPFFLGTLPATFSFEIEITLAAVGGAAPVNPRPRSARGGTVFFMVFVGLRP